MRFSICIPIYNVEKFLNECLDSVINQTFSDFEVVCVNDGSTDNSRNILAKYASTDTRIRIIDKENHGLLWARRDAINTAKGDYLLFVDSDDKFYDKNVLEKLDMYLSLFKNPDMVLFDRVEFGQDGETIFKKNFFNNEMIFEGNSLDEIRYNFITRNYFNAIFLKCVKKTILDEDNTDYSNFNPQMAEDVSQSIFLFDHCRKIVYVPDFFYLYRLNLSSISKSPLSFSDLPKKMVNTTFYSLFNYIDKWKLEKVYPDVYEKFSSKIYSFLCERIIELHTNKNNNHVIKKVLSFDWFGNDLSFLKNEKYLKSTNLSHSFYHISRSIIKNKKSELIFGLVLYKLSKFRKFLKGAKNNE